MSKLLVSIALLLSIVGVFMISITPVQAMSDKKVSRCHWFCFNPKKVRERDQRVSVSNAAGLNDECASQSYIGICDGKFQSGLVEDIHFEGQGQRLFAFTYYVLQSTDFRSRCRANNIDGSIERTAGDATFSDAFTAQFCASGTYFVELIPLRDCAIDSPLCSAGPGHGKWASIVVKGP